MPRARRLDFVGARHHVITRGARRAPIFAVRGARALLLRLLGELPVRFGCTLTAYAILDNHYHLLLESPGCGIAPVVKRLNQVFTQRMNRRMGWDGPVFGQRYHDVLVADPSHWALLPGYVHANPHRAGRTRRIFDPRWTSHTAWIEGGRSTPWLQPGELLEHHGGPSGYAAWFEAYLNGEVEIPADLAPRSCPGDKVEIRPLRPRGSDPGVLLSQLAELTRQPIPKGPTRTALGAVAAWWLRANGLSTESAGRVLEVSPSAIGRRTARALALAHEQPEVAGWIAALAGCDPRTGPVFGTR